MFDRHYILWVLENYVNETYTFDELPNMFKCRKNHEAEWFYLFSYSEWAANEILSMLMDGDPSRLVIDELDDIRRMFDDFACRAKGAGQYMFSVAEDVATDFMDVIIGMEDEEYVRKASLHSLGR